LEEQLQKQAVLFFQHGSIGCRIEELALHRRQPAGEGGVAMTTASKWLGAIASSREA
jgi:hypothetical protein